MKELLQTSFRERRVYLTLIALLLLSRWDAVAAPQFSPGEVWFDTAGQAIQAHSGGVLVQSNAYYWFGEDRTTRKTGVSCYSSTNLYEWKREGVVFSPDALPAELRNTSFIERPKVIFNPHTGKFVAWFHLEQRGYHFARAGVAVSDRITGPFTFVQALRPIRSDFGYKENDPDQQKEFGGTFRDMNLFVDDDGDAYVFYASEGNWTMYVVKLDNEYTGPAAALVEGQNWTRILVREMREAPAPFKFMGRYYLVTSGCTGWKPNTASYAVADKILGPWTSKGNPCTGPEANTTFGAQSTFVLPVTGRPGAFIFMADRWNPGQLRDSRYVWLPLRFKPGGEITIPWRDSWSLSDFDRP